MHVVSINTISGLSGKVGYNVPAKSNEIKRSDGCNSVSKLCLLLEDNFFGCHLCLLLCTETSLLYAATLPVTFFVSASTAAK